MSDSDARIELSSPVRDSRGRIVESEVKPYYCAYCSARIDRKEEDFKVCQKRECIEAAISDRMQKIADVEVSIDQFRLDHDRGAKQKVEQIEALKACKADPALVAQYESLLYQWQKYNRFQGINNRHDHKLRLQAEVEDLVRLLNRPVFDEEFRRRLWERDNQKCYLCNRVIEDWSSEHMHVDHVVPRSKGGSDEEYNLRAAHPECNIRKSDRELGSREMGAALRHLREPHDDGSKGRLF